MERNRARGGGSKAARKSQNKRLVSAVIRRKRKWNRPPRCLCRSGFCPCFHWQQTEGGLQHKQRCEDEDKNVEKQKNSEMVFSCAVMIKLKGKHITGKDGGVTVKSSLIEKLDESVCCPLINGQSVKGNAETGFLCWLCARGETTEL